MLEESFIFLQGVGKKREQELWEQGIHTWDDFLIKKNSKSLKIKSYNDRLIRLARNALSFQDCNFFKTFLPLRESWRLYETFKHKALYLDIETSGYYTDVTVVGIADNFRYKAFVKDINLSRAAIKREIHQAKLIITFNGSSFDLPVLQRRLGIYINIPHIDMRSVCSQIGLRGGLKKIERQLQIQRAHKVQSVTGAEAVYLWQLWRHTKEKEYLEKLIDYNKADVLNLQPLAEYCIAELWKRRKEPKMIGSK